MGEPFNPDFNGASQLGVGFYQFMNRHGRRSSAAYAFLTPLEGDKRLTLRLHSRVERLLIEGGRAIGVEWRDASGTLHQGHARGEIVVTAGALITPKLLMLSGLGPADHLREHGIEVKVNLPGVGQNLIDHPEVPIIATANGKYGYFGQGNGWRMFMNGLQFRIFGTGCILSAGVEAGAFVNPTDLEAEPSIQAFCVPIVGKPRTRRFIWATQLANHASAALRPRWSKVRRALLSWLPRRNTVAGSSLLSLARRSNR